MIELPDEAAIVRIYARLTECEPKLRPADARALGSGAATIAGWADAGLLVLLTLAGIGLWGAVAAAFCGALFLALAERAHAERERRGAAEPGAALLAFGPIRARVLPIRYAEWHCQREQAIARIDPASLAVIEPVARHLAEPILARAHGLTPSVADLIAAERAEARRDELRAQASRETDPVWHDAAREQADLLAARASVLRTRHEEAQAATTLVLADAARLRAYLDLLAERRRLMEEIGESRHPVGAVELRHEGDAMRDRLLALIRHLRAQRAPG